MRACNLARGLGWFLRGALGLGGGRVGGGFVGALVFEGSKEAHAFLSVFAEHVQAEEVGGTGLGAGAGDDGDDFAGSHVAVLLEQALGAIDQGLGGVDLGAADGGGAPEQVEAIDGDLDGAEREDGRGGVVLGELAGGGSGLGEEGDAAQVEIVGGVGRGFADGLGDGEVAVALAGLGVVSRA